MKTVFNLIVLGVTFAAWLVYSFSPLEESKSETARGARIILGCIVSSGLGWSFGAALGGLI